MHKYLIAGLACMHSLTAWAGATATLSEADYFAEQPVVLSASRLSQPVNRAPAAVTVITREMIEASGFRHLVDVLRLVPGFVVGWSGGNNAAATYLGLSDEFPHWMQILVDGRSVYNPAYGQTTWRGIPLMLDEIDRIEVVRGPNAANDGLNSMLGTVHIYTRHTALTQGGMGEVAVGDKQYKEANLRYGGETRDGSWRLSLLGREDERHGVEKDHASDVQLNFRGDFNPTLQDELMLQLGISKGSWKGTNVGWLLSEDQDTDYLSGYANLQWKRVASEGKEWSMQIHHTFNENEEILFDPPNGDYRTTGSGIQFNYLDVAAPSLRTRLSGEYRLNRVYLPGLLGTEEYITDNILSVSGSAEWNPSAEWVFHAAAMLEHHSDTGSANFSPRLAANWLPHAGHAFRIGASRGVTALGMYANNEDTVIPGYGQVFLSVEEVEPENIDSYEIGYLFSKPASGLHLDTRVFHNRIRDILDRVPIPGQPGVKTWTNSIAVDQLGLEYQLRWRPTQQGWLVLSQSWVDTDADPDPNGYYPPSVPRSTLSVLAAHPIAGVDVSIGYYRTSEMRWLGSDADDPESKYNRLDLRLAKDWKTADGRVQVALVVQSLLGEEIESFNYYVGQEFTRRGYVSLKYEFR
jgi:iron complex outermembrane recepter protein